MQLPDDGWATNATAMHILGLSVSNDTCVAVVNIAYVLSIVSSALLDEFQCVEFIFCLASNRIIWRRSQWKVHSNPLCARLCSSSTYFKRIFSIALCTAHHKLAYTIASIVDKIIEVSTVYLHVVLLLAVCGSALLLTAAKWCSVPKRDLIHLSYVPVVRKGNCFTETLQTCSSLSKPNFMYIDPSAAVRFT